MAGAWGVIFAITIIFWYLGNEYFGKSNRKGTVILSYGGFELTVNGTLNFVLPVLGFILTVIAYLANW
jgi:hypothetical protein